MRKRFFYDNFYETLRMVEIITWYLIVVLGVLYNYIITINSHVSRNAWEANRPGGQLAPVSPTVGGQITKT